MYFFFFFFWVGKSEHFRVGLVFQKKKEKKHGDQRARQF